MRTRSQTKEQINEQTKEQTKEFKMVQQYEVNIDFDEASNVWKYNKKSIGNGSYKYICTQLTKSGTNKGKKCGKTCYNESEYCKLHYKCFI